MKRWVIAIVGMLAINVIASVVLAMAANNGDTRVIPHYYERPLHDDRLGWTVTTTARAGVIAVELRDAAGMAIADAHVSASGYARAHAAQSVQADLAPVGGGHYTATTALGAGWCDLAIVATRGADRFEHRVSVEAR